MLYDLYEKKMKRRYYIKNLIIKHKALIIGISSFFSLLLMTFLLIKGTIYDVNYTNHVRYGENFNISAKGIFTDISYQFSVYNQNEWESITPTTPGRYEVKVISNKPFNKQKEERYEFTIYPKEVNLTITNNKVEFAKNPEILIDLIDGDKISFLSFTYADPSQTNTIAIEFDITITNSYGDDVTKFYNINFEETEVEFIPRNITIKLKDQEKVYDGTTLESTQLEETDDFIEGHEIIVSAIGSQKEVGQSTNIIDNVIIRDKNGIDVTRNFSITKETGVLNVIPKDIVIRPEYQEKVYDATPLESKKVEIVDGSLELNQTAEYEIIGSQVTVGTSESVINSYKIFENGVDVSHNYNIKYMVGELVVKPRNITVVFEDTIKVYDGTNVFKSKYDLDLESGNTLVEGHTIGDVYAYSSSQNSGTWTTIDHDIKITSGNEEVTDNYEVNYVYGNLTITKRPITVVFEDATKIYDGNNIFKPDYYLENDNDLVEGQTIGDANVYSSSQNIGIWATAGHDIKIYDANEEVTDNYDLTPLYGGLEITKRHITVDFEDTSKVYDGTNIFEIDTYNFALITSLATNQTIDIRAYSSNQNVGTWTTVGHDIKIYDGNEEVTDNYEVDSVYGELEITKRPITVVFEDATKTYDGTNIFNPEYGLDLESGKDLVLGQTIGDVYVYSLSQNIGTWTTTRHDISIYNGNEDLTDNYDITTVYSNLTITKQQITIVFEDATKVYDGTNVFTPKYGLDLVNGNDLVLGQTIGDVYVYSSNQNVGTWTTVGHDITIYNGIEDVTDNYEIGSVYGNLTITKRHLSIVFEDATKIYDGTNIFEIDSYNFASSTSLATNQTIDIRAYSSDKNVGIWTTIVHDIKIFDATEDVTDNYEIDTVYGNLTITKRPITVIFNDTSKVYDGTNIFEIDSYNFALNTSLATNHTIDIRAYSLSQNVGTWNTINHEMTIYEGIEDVTDNYEIDSVYGGLEITKRNITVVFEDATKTYDGNNVFTPEYGLDLVRGNDLVLGQTIGDVYVYSLSEKIGTWTTDRHDIKIYNGYEEVTDNYDITPVYGNLSITKRHITVVFEDATKVYDGTNVFNPNYNLDLVSGNNLVEGQMIIDAYNYSSNPDVGTWTTIGHDITIYNGFEDVTDNYEIDSVYGNLTITKRPISIVFEDATKIYDGTVSFEIDSYNFVSSTSLATNQTIDIRAYSSDKNVGIWTTIGHDIKISNGVEDVTDNYEIDTVYGNLTITKRPITVVFNDTSKVYDGSNMFEIDSYSFALNTSLAKDQTIDIRAYSSSQNVGTWTTTHHDIKIYDGNEDVTDNYEIGTVYGVLVITKRQVTIDFYDSTKVYDGTNVFNPNYNLNIESVYQLVEGQIISEAFVYTVDSNWGDSKTPSNFNVFIIDSNYVDVSGNYEIIPVYGTFRINKRAITIVFEDATKVYDGTNVFNPNYNIDLVSGNNLVEGQSIIDANIYSSSQNIGTWTTTHHYISIYNGIEDVTDNYEIDSVYGNLTITKRHLSIVFEDATKIYDGNNIFKIDSYNFASSTSLATNQTIDIRAYSSDKNVGIWTTIGHDIKISNGFEDVTGNYEIDTVYGNLTITKRPITVVFNDTSKVYDGTNIFKPQYDLNLESGYSVVEGHTIDLTAYSSSQNVGTWNTIHHEMTIYDGIEDVTDNYEIGTVYGALEITKRQVTIDFYNTTKLYDGTNVFEPNYGLNLESRYNLVLGQSINEAYVYTVDSNWGDSKTPSNFNVSIIDSNLEDVSGNYEIIPVYGTFTIYKRAITIVFEDATKVYDGTNVFNPIYNLDLVNGNNLAEGQSIIEAYNYSSNQNIGTWTTTHHYISIYNGYEDVTDNYEIDSVYGNLTITKRPITVVFNDTSKIYDGNNIFKPNYDLDLVSGNNLAEGQTIDLTAYSSNINVGIWTTTHHEMTIYNGKEDVTGNYQIDTVYGNLTITKRPITVIFNDASKGYDGTNIFKPNYNLDLLSGNDLVEGQIIDLTAYSSSQYVGTWTTIGHDIKIYDGTEDVTGNYQIDTVYGTLTITRRQTTDAKVEEFKLNDVLPNVEIISHDASKQYDGSPLSKDEYYIYGNLAPNHELVIINDSEITNIGTIRNKFSSTIVDKNTGEVVSYLYNIRHVYGDLVIVPNDERTVIEIKPYAYKKVYDGITLALNKDDYWIPSRNLPEGYTIDLEFDNSIKDVGIAEVSIKLDSIVIFDENGHDVTNNFNIVTYSEVLEVTIRKIEVKTMSAQKVYDGKELIHHVYSISKGSLAPGHEIEIIWPASGITEVGTLANKINEVIIRDENGNDVTKNYSITKDIGTLEVYTG